MIEEKWHTLSVYKVMENLGVGSSGLTEEEAKIRLEKYGYNKLKEKKPPSKLKLFLSQFKSFLIILLLFATIVSLLIGNVLDAIAIFTILIIIGILGFIQEYRAEKAVESLKKMIVPEATVIRNGEITVIHASEIVPGDIIVLEQGDRVPADARVIESVNLKTDESTLTGESLPVSKYEKSIEDKPLPERVNMVFMGTTVSYGRGKAVVVSTGMNTQIGKIAEIIQEKEEITPLQKKLNNLGKFLGTIALFVCVIVFLIGMIKGNNPVEMFMTSVALAVSAVPEGLPAIATITLALGIRRMVSKKALVKHLSAVETLGETTVICADKTGTMTTNEMTVRYLWTYRGFVKVTGAGFNPKGLFYRKNKKINPLKEKDIHLLLKTGYLCNNAKLLSPLPLIRPEWKIIGDPTEGALIVAGKKANIKTDAKRIWEIPFSSERKMMTVVCESENKREIYTKGAPELVLELCTHILVNGKKTRLSKKHKDKILEILEEFTNRGLRVLGLAYSQLRHKSLKQEDIEINLTFIGLAGMIDPPRPEVKSAIKKCKQAGIKVVMITGDHKLTAMSIARELEIIGVDSEEFVVTGEEIDKLSEEELDEIVENTFVYARVLPEHKVRILKVLKRKGHVVAMTGDGVNDAPALKKADIGVSMGIKGTEVAKEASDMILLDDNFATIVAAIEEGRGVYDNIHKSVRFLLSANFDEIIETTLAILIGLPLPFLPLQILWINLITDGLPALALSVDPKEEDIMKRRPRNPKKGILSGMLMFILVAAILDVISSFGLFVWTLRTTGDIVKARTVAVTTAIFFELFFVFNCRSEKHSFIKTDVLSNKKLIAAVIISILLQIAVIYVPLFQEVFGTTSLGFIDWVRIVIFSSIALLTFPEVFMRREE